jgi:ferric-dicitrate binding protein FerR (iron transport regulator)
MNKEHYLKIVERYLANHATEEDIQELSYFIKNNPQLNHWFERQIRESPSEISEDLKRQMFNKIRGGIGKPEKHTLSIQFVMKKTLRIAASIFLPIALVYGTYLFVKINANETEEPLLVVAEKGEKANVVLPDGSKVCLNSGSTLTYYNTYNRNDRFLKLDGEAYFEVAPNPKKTFTVQCIDMKIEVVGTTFGIKAYDEDFIISTVLEKGKVKITTPDKIQIMHPNDRVVYSKSDKKSSSEIVKPADFTDWRKNRLRFENETLLTIAKTIARIHNVDYIFEDETIQNLRFTGSVDNTNVASVLHAITLTAPIGYTVKNSLIIFHKDNRQNIYFQ